LSSHSLTRPQLSIKNLTSPLLTGNYSDLVCSAVYRSETSGLSLEAHQSSIIQLDHMHHDRNARQTQPSQRKPTTRLLEPSSSLPAPHETKENTALHTLQRNQDIFGSKYRGPTTVARTHTTQQEQQASVHSKRLRSDSLHVASTLRTFRRSTRISTDTVYLLFHCRSGLRWAWKQLPRLFDYTTESSSHASKSMKEQGRTTNPRPQRNASPIPQLQTLNVPPVPVVTPYLTTVSGSR